MKAEDGNEGTSSSRSMFYWAAFLFFFHQYSSVVSRTALCFLEYFSFFGYMLFQELEARKNDVIAEGLIYFPPHPVPMDESQSKPRD